MRKNVFGRQLKRDTNERKALFKSLMSSLVLHERIQTTEAKAKAVKGALEKLVTKAKKGNAIKQMFTAYLTPEAIDKLFSSIAPRFVQRPGGYLRIIRLKNRFSDNASMVLIEWVEGPREEKVEKVEEVEKVEKVDKGKALRGKDEKPKRAPRKRGAKK